MMPPAGCSTLVTAPFAMAGDDPSCPLNEAEIAGSMPARVRDSHRLAAAGHYADPGQPGQNYRLGAHERMQTDKDYPAARGCGLLLLPIAIVMAPTAVVPFFDPGEPAAFSFGLIWAPVIGVIGLAGALLVWRSRLAGSTGRSGTPAGSFSCPPSSQSRWSSAWTTWSASACSSHGPRSHPRTLLPVPSATSAGPA